MTLFASLFLLSLAASPDVATHAANDALVWTPQTVLFPLAKTPHVLAQELLVKFNTPDVGPVARGSLKLQTGQTFGVVLPALELLRVRSIDGSARPTDLRISVERIASDGNSAVSTSNAALPVDQDSVYLLAPPGDANFWLVTAKEPVSILVERPFLREGSVVWEGLREALQDHCIKGDSPPSLPPYGAMPAVQKTLDVVHSVTRYIRKLPGPATLDTTDAVERALQAFCLGTVAQAFDLAAPHHAPVFRFNPHEKSQSDWPREASFSSDDDATSVDRQGAMDFSLPPERTWHRMQTPTGRVDLEVTGPAIALVEMRALWPMATPQTLRNLEAIAPRKLVLTVKTDSGASITEQRILSPALTDPTPAALRAVPRQNLLLTDRREPLSYRSFVRVAIPPGTRRVSISLSGGPALFRIATAHRQLTLEEARSMTWVQRLQEAERNLMSASARDDRRAQALHKRLSGLLQTAQVLSPTEGLISAENHGTAPGVDSQPETVVQDPVVAAADLAWRMAPMDENLRRRHRDLWREATRWRTLTPGAIDENSRPLPSPLRFIETRPASGDSRVVTERNLLWPIRPAVDAEVQAPVSPDYPARTAIWRLYVRRGNGAPGPITIRIGKLHTQLVPILPVEVLEFGLRPGRHAFRVDTPTGVLVSSSLPVSSQTAIQTFAEPQPFVRSLWLGAYDGIPTKFTIPDSKVAGPVRLQFRSLSPTLALQRLTLHSDTGATRDFTLKFGERDPDWVAVNHTGSPSRAAEIVVYLPATTRQLWFSGSAVENISITVAVRAPNEEAKDTLLSRTAIAPSNSLARSGDTATAAEVLQRVHRTSAELANNAKDPTLLMNRIEALLEADEGIQAQHDLLRLLDHPGATKDASQNKRRTALIERLDSWMEPTHLRHTSETDAVFPIRPIALAYPAWGREPGVAMLAREVQTLGLRESLQRLNVTSLSDSTRAYFRAHLLEHLGQFREAALAYLQVDPRLEHWQAQFQAMAPLVRALIENPADESLAVLGFAAASSIETHIGHPELARALAVTARLTHWIPIRRAEQTAGFEHLFSQRKLTDLTPNAQMRWALTGAPWDPSESHVLRPGRGAAMDLRLRNAANVSIQTWCVRWRSRNPLPVTCPVRYQIDSEVARSAILQANAVVDVTTQNVKAGQHRLEVTHTARQDDALLVVRFSDGNPIPITFPGRWFTVHGNGEPAELSIQGPAVVRVEGRRHETLNATTLAVSAEQGGKRLEWKLPLSHIKDDAAASDRKDPLFVSHASEQNIILPGSGGYRVALRADGGTAAFRLFLRTGRAHASIPPMLQRLTEAQLDDEDGHALTPQPYILARAVSPTATPPWATLSLGLTAGRETFVERDTPTVTPSNLVAMNLDWRRRLDPRRAWLGSGLTVRWNEADLPFDSTHAPGALSIGAHVRSDFRNLPFGIGVQTLGRVMVQLPTGNGPTASATHGQFGINRLVATGVNTSLLPSLSLVANHMGYQPPAPGVPDILGNIPDPLTVDPMIYNAYDHQHPLTLQASLTNIWFAYQDQLGMAGLRATANPDFVTLDNLQAQFVWRGLLPNPTAWRTRGWAPTFFQLRYRPSLRLADDHRATTTVRHDLGASIVLSRWRGSFGRALVEVKDDLAIALGANPRNTLMLSFRFDFTSGRGLLDLFPTEDDFSALLTNVPWGDVP